MKSDPVEAVIEAMEPPDEPNVTQCLADCVRIIEAVQKTLCDLGPKANEILVQSKRALARKGV